MDFRSIFIRESIFILFYSKKFNNVELIFRETKYPEDWCVLLYSLCVFLHTEVSYKYTNICSVATAWTLWTVITLILILNNLKYPISQDEKIVYDITYNIIETSRILLWNNATVEGKKLDPNSRLSRTRRRTTRRAEKNLAAHLEPWSLLVKMKVETRFFLTMHSKIKGLTRPSIILFRGSCIDSWIDAPRASTSYSIIYSPIVRVRKHH